jgi:mono/diheme cytochrome c family protein
VRAWPRLLGVVLAVIAIAVAWVWWRNRDDAPPSAAPTTASGAPGGDLIARGAYLVRAGDCIGCHTARGGEPYAGGRGIETPFGVVYAPNLTPDPETGLGHWTDDDFWRALHNGRSRDGRLLYPAFPYPNYTRVTRADADAMHAYLRSLAPVVQPNLPHALRFPVNLQPALAVWRALYFEPGVYAPDSARSAGWNRGAYLVEGLGHCNACHTSRNALGAPVGPFDLAGGMIPVQNWYAPSLTSVDESSVAEWKPADVIELLRDGVSARNAVMGPMVEVVLHSTQYLTPDDLGAVTEFLRALPQTRTQAVAQSSAVRSAGQAAAARGATLYGTHCAGCHGEQGEGVPRAYPALAGSRAVTMASPANLVHVVLRGGFPPATRGNPRPFGMPPFATVLSDEEVADLLSYIRGTWGNRAPAVSALEITRYRDTRP